MALFFPQNTTYVYDDVVRPSVLNSQVRRTKTSKLSLTTSPLAFTATVSDRTLNTGVTASGFVHTDLIISTNVQPMTDSMVTEKPGTAYTTASYTETQTSASEAFGSSAYSLTTVSPATLPSWLTTSSDSEDVTSDSSPLGLTLNQLRLSTRDAFTGFLSTRSAASSLPSGGGC